MNAFIRLLYALLIAISVAVFIGVGIVSFYSPPKSPEYPNSTVISNDTSEGQSEKSRDAYAKYDAERKTYDAKQKSYQRNVTYIVLPLAAIVLLGGLFLMIKPGVIGEGLALGGIMTTVYGVITASMASSNPLRFVAVTLLLLGVLLTAQLRFGNKPKISNQHAKFLGRIVGR